MCKPPKWYRIEISFWRLKICQGTKTAQRYGQRKREKEKLREFLSLLEVEDMSDLRSVFKEMVGEVLENGLEAELDDELGVQQVRLPQQGYRKQQKRTQPENHENQRRRG